MKKTIIIISCILVALGLVITGVSLLLGGSFEEDTQRVTYDIEGDFTDIDIKTSDANIIVKSSESGKSYVECDESDKITYKVEIKNGRLLIEEDIKSFLAFFGIRFSARMCILYLSNDSYGELEINSGSGRIDCTDQSLSFSDAEVNSASGDVFLASRISEDVEIATSSGDITVNGSELSSLKIATASGSISLSDIISEGAAKITSASGDIHAENINSGSLKMSSSSGKITLKSALVSGISELNTGSGDIELISSDSGEYNIETGSGNVWGTLLSTKLFDVSTGSGRINVPPSENGGKCKIKTGSGNINISIE